MNRKEFIGLSLFAATAIGLPSLSSCHFSDTEQALSHPLFIPRLFSQKQIEEAGKVYMIKTPEENNKDKLINLLSDKIDIAKSTNTKAIEQYFNNKVKQDFASGNTIVLKGWILSLTEARQCALYSLLNR